MAEKYTNTEAFIKKYGKEVESEIKTRLLSYNKKASGKLYRSIKFDMRESVKSLDASWRMEDYGAFVDGGIKGAGVPTGFGGKMKPVIKVGRFRFGSKQPPIDSIKKWCKVKGIDKGAAYAISRSIWIFGIAPTNFFTIPTTRRAKYFENQIGVNMAKDIDTQLQKEIDGNN